MYPCTNPRCGSRGHNEPECPNLVHADLPQRRNLVVLGVLAVAIVSSLVLAAFAAAPH
ncbi:hypothetical protein ACQPZ2_43485 [Nocardia pseudovaccinii]|uniref:hypothetical protein n=1 Tax=Nocardia pseudovaccinii TaxID=189540 RepID=UPI000A49DD5E